MGGALLVVVVTVVAAAVSFGWWAANRIDTESLDQQRRSLSIGLKEVTDRIPVECSSRATRPRSST